MNHSQSSAPATDDAVTAGDGRYELQEQLGRGGMACVHRAKDRVSGRSVALKQLTAARSGREHSLVASLFEREFHTLAQLRHPHVIAVYDYGVFADGSPFYTMELLDGGDLRELAPLPWQRACGLFFEVCSSLALLHSRRLLHRDISPLNIRCTRDGRAKLIDFGAMVPMGASGSEVVGTPAFVAPETLHRLNLDARTDLFSLGATLYFALTGQVPFPARSFAEVINAWGGNVRAPSEFEPNIPAALDDLVLSLIGIEPALRPRSAFDVMQQLAAIADLAPDESDAVSRAYLATPLLVGRESALDQFRQNLLSSRVSPARALLLKGPPGIGRSRLLDACVLEAKTLGFTVLRVTAIDDHEPFAVVQGLAQHLTEALPAGAHLRAPELFTAQPADAAESGETSGPALPKLRDFAHAALDADQLQRSIARFFLSGSQTRPLLVAVDDIHHIDPQSAGVLAAVLDRNSRGRLFVVLSSDSETPPTAASGALARRCAELPIAPLSSDETRALLSSVFGEVANLDLLARELYAVTHGVPRQCMDLAQHLIDRGLIRYAGGGWSLPNQLATRDLPRSASEAVCARVAQLSAPARELAQALALAFDERLSTHQCHSLLTEQGPGVAEAALAELVARGVVVSHAAAYALPNQLWIDALTRSLDDAQAEQRHQQLARVYQPRSRIAFIYHAFAGGLDAEGLDELAKLNEGYAQRLDMEQVVADNVAKMMDCYPRALQSAERLGKGPRFVNELRRWNFAGDVLLEDAGPPASSQLWLAQLRHDSGLDLYERDPDTSDPMQRLMRALQGAQARYQATPEPQRCYTVEEAIRLLGEYVVIGIAFSARTQDSSMLRSLPALVEPFAPLSPALDAIWKNALATYAAQGQGFYTLAHERWLGVLEQLDALDRSAMPFVDSIANAVAFGVGLMEAQLGLPTASSWADRLERDPAQRVAALQLRRIVRLEQGDARGAERFRKQAELLALQGRAQQMLKALLAIELTACADARDLSGMQDVVQRMRPIAERFPNWRPNLLYAEACFHFIRGDHAAAINKCNDCIRLTTPDAEGNSLNMLMWSAATLCLAEVTLASGDAAAALAIVQRLMLRHQALGMEQTVSVEVTRVLALAKAKLGLPGGVEHLEAAIEDQTQRGITGLRLGVTYEARAQLAIWQRDADAFERYAALTAHEYRHGAGSALGARYERLVNEARRQGLHTTAELEQFAAQDSGSSSLYTLDIRSTIHRSMAQELSLEGRARTALQLICAARSVDTGQLYLCGPSGLTLQAIRGSVAPLKDLSPLTAFLTEERQRAEELDEMATDDLPTESTQPSGVITADGVELKLLLLSCERAGKLEFPGVVAVATQGAVDALRQQQLLAHLAAHFLTPED